MLRNADGGCQIFRKNGYEGVRFNIISVIYPISRKNALRNTLFLACLNTLSIHLSLGVPLGQDP